MIRKDYAFSASAKTITFTNAVAIEQLGVITNIVDGVQVYNPMDISKVGTLSGQVLSLAYNTTSMSDADQLQIFYGNSESTMPVADGVVASFLLRIVALLSSPRGYDKSQGRQRVTGLVESGTITTVTTVTGLTNLNGRDAGQMLINPQSRTSWALNHRSRIS